MKYTSDFFDYVDSGALASANIIVAHLYPLLSPASVLDVGCGRGGWLRAWRDAGAAAIQGVDGAYVDRGRLHVAEKDFLPTDITRAFDLDRRFDLVQCLEVAEHIRPETGDTLVENLVRHGDVVLFSAAQPGQGGTQHINERPLRYWHDAFKARGYGGFDCVRPAFHADARIEPWYRLNALLYANAAGQDRLPAAIKDTAVLDIATLPDYAPLAWRVRRAVFRYMPVPVVDQVARLNATIKRRIRRAAP